MTAKPSAMLKVWSIEETGYLVRGTLDVELAVQAANKYEGAPEDELREWDATPGLYRCNPCTCSGDHSFDLVSASQRGPGVFEGVLLDHGW